MRNHTDPMALLKKDHETVKALFKQSEKAEGANLEPIFKQIRAALEVHATIEEEIFYPAVKKARSENVKDEVREALEEHKQIKTLLREIASTPASDKAYPSKLKVLMEDVEHHVKEEEGEMFPDAKKFLSAKQLETLGEQMEARKQELEGGEEAAPKKDPGEGRHPARASH